MGRSGFWIRAVAALIDAIVFAGFALTIWVAASVLEARGALTDARTRGLEALLLAIWLVYTAMEVMVGATLGKLATGIVITLPDGAPAPPWTRLLRWSTKQGGWILYFVYATSDQLVFYYLAGVLNFVLLIGLLRALDEEKRAWHDYWSHTAVVSRRRAAAMLAVHEEPVGPPAPT
jgi:uncharacterized RDD family membrane protein YckC